MVELLDLCRKIISIAQNTLGDPKGRFLVVYANEVVGDFKSLRKAKDKLMEYPKPQRKPSRIVVEVKNGRVLDDPRFQVDHEWTDYLQASTYIGLDGEILIACCGYARIIFQNHLQVPMPKELLLWLLSLR